MTNPNTDFDTPWKDVLEIYFEDFVSFFFPQAHAGKLNGFYFGAPI
jgi:hypothetical protein